VIKVICCCLLALPLRHLQVASAYGDRIHPVTGRYAFHTGVDLRAQQDTVFAVLNGIVSDAGYDRLLGIYIRLEHGDFESSYGHLSQLLLLPGDVVSAGDAIAVSGYAKYLVM
jgi:murein DD-endopeptidase MepM/ murein hydrolase activator NlpD